MANRWKGLEVVYIIRMFNENESFFKIGISGDLVRRICKLRQSKYSVEVIKLFEFDFKDWNIALNLEQELHNKNKNTQYITMNKFGGYLECYKSYLL